MILLPQPTEFWDSVTHYHMPVILLFTCSLLFDPCLFVICLQFAFLLWTSALSKFSASFPSFASVTPWNRKLHLPWSLPSTPLPPLFLLFPQKLTRWCWTDSALDNNLWSSKVNGPNFSKHYALIPKSCYTNINSFVESVMSGWHSLQGHRLQAWRALLRQQHKDPVWRREQQDIHGKELSTQSRTTKPIPRRWRGLYNGHQKGRFRITSVQAENQWHQQKTEVFFMASELTAKHHGYSDRGLECLPSQYRYGPLESGGNSQMKQNQVYSSRVYWWKDRRALCHAHDMTWKWWRGTTHSDTCISGLQLPCIHRKIENIET